jgi:hypothetical protein
MSAILPGTEGLLDITAERTEESKPRFAGRGSEGFHSFDGVMQEVQPLNASHAGLTRLLWIRKELEQAFVGREYRIVQDAEGLYALELVGDPIAQDVIPWMMGTQDQGFYRLFGKNGKMLCPSFDLAAGAPVCGGACPGSIAAQSVVPLEYRKKFWRDMPPPPGLAKMEKLREEEAICQSCYSSEGRFNTPTIQGREVALTWWVKDSMATEQGRAEFIRVMVAAIPNLCIRPSREGIKPIRIHSSGDFINPAYVRCWVEIANQIGAVEPTIRFWAPTRCWAHPGFTKVWDVLNDLEHENMVVRPSAYHIGDAAPEALIEGQARGTSVVLNHENLGMTLALESVIEKGRVAQYENNRKTLGREGPDARFDWDCIAAGTRVPVRGGGMPAIEDVVADVLAGKSVEVLTRSGWRKATAARVVGRRPIVTVETDAGYTLRCTADHRVAVDCDQQWVAAKDLSPGVVVVLAPEDGQALHERSVALPVFDPATRSHWGSAANISDDSYKFPTHWDRDLGVVLGFLTGDGSFSDRNLQVEVGSAKQKALVMVGDILNRWLGRPVGYSERLSDNSEPLCRLFVADGALRLFLVQFGLEAGCHSPLRRVPAELFKAPASAVLGYLAGLFAADGSVSVSREGRITAELSSTSKGLLRDVKDLFTLCGGRTGFCEHQPRPPYQTLMSLSVTSNAALDVLRQATIITEAKREVLARLPEKKRRHRNTRVVSVQDTGEADVFDLSVSEDPEFSAGGLVVHNCQTYSTRFGENEDATPNCMAAIGPDGKVGCRACWLRRDLRVNYTAH